ncbi:MAG TPA: hypothetical protein VE136_04340 [Anaerolineales bacterium]|jgi:hypothetical protein|nr:hypothetical protein [Anaerolineales bacterium]
MDMSIATYRTEAGKQVNWLRSRDWDLTWISLSVVLVAAPYLAYLGLLNLETIVQPLAGYFGASPDSLARNLVNAVVALLVGGPHMYATFTRTALDRGFAKKHSRMMWSSLIIPLVVVILAMLNLALLLTIFFFWASIHVLHQIIYIIELYNHKQKSSLSRFSRLADYGVVLTALYPLAAWKITKGTFLIGTNDLGAVVGSFIPVGPWMVWLAGGAFGIALIAWIGKSVHEYYQGKIHWPKTSFIALTFAAAFFVPALGNLDTAFQGMNVWHSLQYLALTWMLNHLRQKRGELESSPFVERLSTDGTARRYYLFNVGLTIADAALAGVIFVVLLYVFKFPFDYAFDRGYYIAVLSFLWIHYYHDHFLFSEPQVIAE